MARSLKNWSKKNCKLENCLERIQKCNNVNNPNVNNLNLIQNNTLQPKRLFEIAKSTIILYKYLILNNVQLVNINTLKNIKSNIELNLNIHTESKNEKIKNTRKRKHLNSLNSEEDLKNLDKEVQVNQFNSTMTDYMLYENENENEQENNVSQFYDLQETTQEINYVSCNASEYCGNYYLDPVFLNENGFCKVCADALQNYYIHLHTKTTNLHQPRNFYFNDFPYQQNVYDQNYQNHVHRTHMHQNYQAEIQTSHINQINQQYDQGFNNDLNKNTAMSNWIEKLVDTNAALTLIALSKSKSNPFSCSSSSESKCKNGKKYRK